jgi:hypothetical protein
VVLLKIDPMGISALKFERSAPWTVHMNRVPDRLSMQTVEVESEDIHILRLRRTIKLIESAQDSGRHLRIDLGRLAFGPEVAKGLVPEGLDQRCRQNPISSKCKLIAYADQGRSALN